LEPSGEDYAAAIDRYTALYPAIRTWPTVSN